MLVSLLTALFCALLHIPCSLIIPFHLLFLAPAKVLSPFLSEKRLERWFLQVVFRLNTHFLEFCLLNLDTGYSQCLHKYSSSQNSNLMAARSSCFEWFCKDATLFVGYFKGKSLLFLSVNEKSI